MKFKNRFIYLLYYLKNLNIKKFNNFLNYASKVTGKTKISLLADAICSVFKYNTSLNDFFSFRFYTLNSSERAKWAGTGFMYEYQLKMNPKDSREVLENKIKFLNHFRPFINRNFSDLSSLESDKKLLEELLQNKSGKLVLKGSMGQAGTEIEIIKCSDFSPLSLISYMQKNNYDLIEQYVVQHPALMDLSPTGLNTVRIITQLNKKGVDFIGGRLRISVNSFVDNMAAGNLAAAIDMETGAVKGPGVYSDTTKLEQITHPITGKPIIGFVIPFWNEVMILAKKAALHTPENRSVGWDIAITSVGPELIEGNHNWCKLLWQLPVNKGLKKVLEQYL